VTYRFRLLVRFCTYLFVCKIEMTRVFRISVRLYCAIAVSPDESSEARIRPASWRRAYTFCVFKFMSRTFQNAYTIRIYTVHIFTIHKKLLMLILIPFKVVFSQRNEFIVTMSETILCILRSTFFKLSLDEHKTNNKIYKRACIYAYTRCIVYISIFENRFNSMAHNNRLKLM
jgi:hypothetical protein